MAVKPVFTLEGDKELIKALRDLSGAQVDKAIGMGFRRTKTATKGYIAKAVSQNYAIKQKDVKDSIVRETIKTSPPAELKFFGSTKPISMRKFRVSMGVRWVNRANVRVSFFKGKKTEISRGWRWETFASGNPFAREGDSRTPIRKIHGISFHHLFTGGRRARRMRAEVERKAMPRLTTEVKQALRAVSRGYVR